MRYGLLWLNRILESQQPAQIGYMRTGDVNYVLERASLTQRWQNRKHFVSLIKNEASRLRPRCNDAPVQTA